MRLSRIIGVSVLSVGLCLLLAWATMVIVHAAPQEVGSGVERFPAPAVAPPDPSAAQPATDPSAAELEVYFAPVRPPGSRSGGGAGSGMRTSRDPLKDVSDLSKATSSQLQSGDRYLESKTRRLAAQYAQAKDTEEQPVRANLKSELDKTIRQHFDVRHQVRKREIDELEARVRRLREHLQKRQQARQTICEMRLNQFTTAAEGLGWDADFGRGRSSSYGVPEAGSYGPWDVYDGPAAGGRPAPPAIPLK